MGLFTKTTNTLKVVYEDDLITYLKSIGVFGDIEKGKRRCKFCGRVITIDNFEALIPNGKRIEFICSNKNCLNQI